MTLTQLYIANPVSLLGLAIFGICVSHRQNCLVNIWDQDYDALFLAVALVDVELVTV